VVQGVSNPWPDPNVGDLGSGQGVRKERSLTSKVQGGIHVLNVPGGSILIRLADELAC
jgi:hypothetical protein